MLNKTIHIGRLTEDPMYKKAASGKDICRFTLACNRTSGGRADYIPVTILGDAARPNAAYTQKATMVAVEGRLQTSSYTDSEGIRRRGFEVLASRVTWLKGTREEPLALENSSAGQVFHHEG